MNFRLRLTIESEYIWNRKHEEIEKIKNKFDHQSNEFKELETALLYIPNHVILTEFPFHSINDDL
jgi:hypothetical protein